MKFKVFQTMLIVMFLLSSGICRDTDVSPDAQVEYLGCILNSFFARTLNYIPLNHYALTKEICINHCIDGLPNASYAGTQNGFDCWCDNVTRLSVNPNFEPNKCNVPCAGNEVEICGGEDYISLYKISSGSSVKPTQEIGSSAKSTVDHEAPFFTSTSNVRYTSDERFATTGRESQLVTSSSNLKPTPKESGFSTMVTTKPEPETTPNTHDCLCPCYETAFQQISDRELAEKIGILQTKISVNKKSTSMYKSTKKSADDSRRSSEYLGFGGVFILLLPVIFILVNDVIIIFKYTQWRKAWK